jgi:hypothetical protein
MELAQGGPAACRPDGLALQCPPDLANLADLGRSNPPDNGAAVWQEVHNADTGQADESFPNGGLADAETLGQFARYQVRARSEPTLEDVG